MPSDKDTRKAIIKFAQLYNLFNQRRNKKYFDSVIQDLVDVNCQVPSNAYLELHKSHIIGYTALHIAVQMEQIEVVHRLLNQGIDFTMKNRSGSTALHDALQKSVNKIPGWKLNGRLDDSFIRPILSRHVATHNAINPSNECGITHFHVACMTNQTEAIELFLDKGVPVDHAVGQTLPVCPGYTGLHFAARCCGLEAMEILLKRGADAKAQDAKKMTPMQMIVENIIEMVEMIRSGNDEVYENITEDFGKNLRMMVLLMGWETSAVDSVGLSHVHVACTMRDTSVIERLLEQNVDVNQIVKVDSPVWPGYTPLHFAAMFNFEIVKLLLTKGANVEAKDAKGITPFQICLERYGFEEIHYLLSNHDVWQNVVLSDATTKLTDLVRAMGNLKEFESLLRNIDANQENRLNMHVAIDSPLWPGNTILHLAVIFYDMTRNLGKVDPAVHRLQMIEECLRLGSDVTITNADGYTPLHLAFRAGRDDAVEKMLQHHHSIDNPVDDSGLSHLHIACAANNKLSVVILLISSKSNVNLGLQTTFMWYGTLRNTFGLSRRCLVHLRSGSTPLHVAVTIGSAEIVELLLKHGASLYARDADGLTPIHCVLTSCDRATIGKTLLSARRPSVHECVTDSGLSHLHIASFVNSVHTITSLLEHGADVDLAIAGEFITNASVDACDNPFTFVNSLSITRNVDEPDNQISVTLDRDTPSDESVEGLIDPYGDPPIDPYGESDKYLKRYAGFTPLHFAMRANSRDAVHLLIDRGADILARSNGHTPLYDTLNCVYNYLEEFTTLLIADVALRERVRHDTGITMLHIACHRINIDMVRELLSNADTDINATINSDSPVWPGSTPLHVLLIMWENNFYTTTNVANMIVDVMVLLLNNGADVKKQNAQLDTPLHIADRIFFLSDAYPITSPAHTSLQ
ncbi:ankyrin-3-like isoform X2 [Phymastichus coffea]|uniref:ankyrin-3-like isoform X2 n=1 Tax=Phymastichus coffea TaxID=108790 RepID=UPI00273B0DFE|nr:ankyrin-3-like isoform X2 [Phymastichus coffea]